MLIDWFTVAAQVVNFIILALLLRRFLYKPVVTAIAKRKQKIADDLAQSEAIRKEALVTRDLYEEKLREFEKEKRQILTDTLQEAENEKAVRRDEIQKETEELRSKLMKAFRNEQQSIHNQISQRARQEVFNLARKTLQDLSSQNLERHIVEEFVRHLEDTDPLETQKIRQTIGTGGYNKLVVRTAFALDSERQKSIVRGLRRLLDLENISPEFGIKPALICGIEVQINHYKIEWHIAGYLEEVEG